MTDGLRKAVVDALQEAAEAEARAYAGPRPVVGTWGDRIMEALARHGLRVVEAEGVPSDEPVIEDELDWGSEARGEYQRLTAEEQAEPHARRRQWQESDATDIDGEGA